MEGRGDERPVVVSEKGPEVLKATAAPTGDMAVVVPSLGGG
jgi:hypothetical protein